jgi:hypothetical protein
MNWHAVPLRVWSYAVGEIENPMLETMRRLWWRAFDRASYWILCVRLSIHDRPEPPTPLERRPVPSHRSTAGGLKKVRDTIPRLSNEQNPCWLIQMMAFA